MVGTIAKVAEKKYQNLSVEILSSDKDMYQLISNKTVCVVPKQGIGNPDIINEQELFKL
ncbi:hypothetical protein JIY74_26840 [Vibrio harveyi]|nr:hypothetical protein [Vibrio harveyi]